MICYFLITLWCHIITTLMWCYFCDVMLIFLLWWHCGDDFIYPLEKVWQSVLLKTAGEWQSVQNAEKMCVKLRKCAMKICWNLECMRKCAKKWYRYKKAWVKWKFGRIVKVWESLLEVEKLWENVLKDNKAWEYVLKVEKVCLELRKYA